MVNPSSYCASELLQLICKEEKQPLVFLDGSNWIRFFFNFCQIFTKLYKCLWMWYFQNPGFRYEIMCTKHNLVLFSHQTSLLISMCGIASAAALLKCWNIQKLSFAHLNAVLKLPDNFKALSFNFLPPHISGWCRPTTAAAGHPVLPHDNKSLV